MKIESMKISRIIFHPFLFAIYPPLFLLQHNLHEINPINGLRSLLVSLLLGLVILLFCRLFIRDWQRAALTTSLIIILFFSYGHVRSILPDILIGNLPLTSHRYMYAIWFILIGLLTWWAGWKANKPERLTPYLNLLSTALVITSIIQGLIYLAQFGGNLDAKTQEKMEELGISTITEELTKLPESQMRDIYYIILDGYSRTDIMKNEIGFDNSDFIQALKERGFYIAECSSSNYDATVFSLGSAFNLDYIPPIGSHLLKDHVWRDFGDYFRYNVVRNTFSEMGYKTVTFDTGSRWSTIKNSDYFFSMQKETPILDALLGGVTEFENMLMDTTLLARRDSIARWITGKNPEGNQQDQDQAVFAHGITPALYDLRYNFIQYTINQLSTIPTLPGKKFVYAHIYATHSPLLFDKDGSFKPDDSIQGYINAVSFIDKKIIDIIDQILMNTEPKPIIIIQGDHGREASEYEFGILNAYYLPEGGDTLLYPTISPVNSFRLVFNYYFSAKFDFLPDKSFSWKYEGDMITLTQQPHQSSCEK